MQKIIEYGQRKDGIEYMKIDLIQFIITSYIINSYFSWLCIVLFLNRKNIKNPINLILFGYYFLSSTSEAFGEMKYFAKKEPGKIAPYSTKYWDLSYGVYYILWFLAEMIGDWYMVLRTKVIAYNKRKLDTIYIICFAYNLIKGYIIVLCVKTLRNPLNLTNARTKHPNNNYHTNDMKQFNYYWWAIIVGIQGFSIIYDISLLIVLRRILFNRLKECHEKDGLSFLEKFKQISELRIILSIAFSIVLIPFFLIQATQYYNSLSDGSDLTENNLDEKIRQFRNMAVSINYTFMYVDQILLKLYFTNKKEKTPDINDQSLHLTEEVMTTLTTITTTIVTTHNNNMNSHSLNSPKKVKTSNRLAIHSQYSNTDLPKGDNIGLYSKQLTSNSQYSNTDFSKSENTGSYSKRETSHSQYSNIEYCKDDNIGLYSKRANSHSQYSNSDFSKGDIVGLSSISSIVSNPTSSLYHYSEYSSKVNSTSSHKRKKCFKLKTVNDINHRVSIDVHISSNNSHDST